MTTNVLETLRIALDQFSRERDWHQFHTPKNLSMALSVEVAELVEHFQWLTPEKNFELDVAARDGVVEEMADILLYLVRMANVLGIDLYKVGLQKIEAN